MDRETVIYNGTKYHRYPQAKRRTDRDYFRSRKGLLHRVMWEDAYGKIPAGHSIHHKDLDFSHNELSNFVCKGNALHRADHNRERVYDLDHLARIEPLRLAGFRQWATTDEGRASLRDRLWGKKQPVIKICLYCGEEYSTIEPSHSKFCSPNHKAANRRAMLRNKD